MSTQDIPSGHHAERLFVSDRGLHICLKTEADAKAAYDDAIAKGASGVILEGTQLIDPQVLQKNT